MKLLQEFLEITKILIDLRLNNYYSYNICNKNDM